jgi:hypothetical protein
VVPQRVDVPRSPGKVEVQTMLQECANLNDAVIAYADGEEVPIRELRSNAASGVVTAFFTDLEVHLVREIRQWPCVVGCMSWLTDEAILQALAQCQEVSILVQKEIFLHPGERIIQSLTPLYDDLKPFNRLRTGLRYNADEDPMTAPVRCVGKMLGERGPKMHHKFLVFCDYRSSHRQPGVQLPDPRAVWTGSLNATHNGMRSLQNALLIRDANIANAYFHEWNVLLGLSEPLDTQAELLCPEYRIGA